MKYFCYAFILACTVLSCSNEDCKKLDEIVRISVDEEICLEDKLYFLKVESTEHKYCPCEVFCDLADQLIVHFSLSSSEIVSHDSFNLLGSQNAHSIFGSFKISSITYYYDNVKGAVPRCVDEYDERKLELEFSISHE